MVFRQGRRPSKLPSMARHRFSPYTWTTGQGSAAPEPATRRSGWKSLTRSAAPSARAEIRRGRPRPARPEEVGEHAGLRPLPIHVLPRVEGHLEVPGEDLRGRAHRGEERPPLPGGGQHVHAHALPRQEPPHQVGAHQMSASVRRGEPEDLHRCLPSRQRMETALESGPARGMKRRRAGRERGVKGGRSPGQGMPAQRKPR